jgi:hypothetical protein
MSRTGTPESRPNLRWIANSRFVAKSRPRVRASRHQRQRYAFARRLVSVGPVNPAFVSCARAMSHTPPSARRLVAAIRRNAAEQVAALLASAPELVNSQVEVEPATTLPHESVCMSSPLIEACRSHAWAALGALQAGPTPLDVNAAVVGPALTTTALADASRRGDVPSVARLLAMEG